MTDSTLYPIAVLIDELKADDQKKRIHSVQSIATICIALGPERTRNELLPFILDLLEDDEEVLTALATVLGTLLDHIGGPAQADHLLKVLERLCLIEERSVRQKVSQPQHLQATDSIKSILSAIRLKDYEQGIMAMLKRLIAADSTIARFCVVQLIPCIFPFMQQTNQAELLDIFSKITMDTSPQTRKHSAQVLIEMINLIPQVSDSELLKIFANINKDEQDSVRMHSVDCIVAFSKHLPKNKVAALLPTVKKLAEDKSWRIRCIVAQQLLDLAGGITVDQVKEFLLPCLSQFLSDTEGEVRVAAVSKISEFCKLLDADTIVTKVVPAFAELQKDQYQFVRAALAETILALCPLVGKQATTQHILPVFLLLLRDENSEVRLNLFKRLDDLNSVIGIDELSTSLVPSLEELAKDKNWRLKIQVIEKFPMLARQLGETFFNEKLNAICIVWLKDSVFSVREAALAMFKQVAKLFGDAWVVKFYLPALMSLQSEISYLHRLTVQFGMVQLAEVVTVDLVKTKFMPLLVQMSKDPVANVRLNVAKSLQAIKGQIKQNKDCLEQAKQVLKVLQSDKDTDVAFFALRALKSMS